MTIGDAPVLKSCHAGVMPPLMKGTIMLITPQEIHKAEISTRFIGTGYDMAKTDRLLDNCEQTIQAITLHSIELQKIALAMKHLLEAHNIPIPSAMRGIA